jgi:ABC-type antimicrobial peptide transport system permease subunit
MFRYAVKRIIRGRTLFLALFLSVALSATLFAGILQGADAVGVSLLHNALRTAPFDIVSSAPDKNITKTRIYDIENVLGGIEGIEHIDHFIRWTVELQAPNLNGTSESIVIALPDDSVLYEGINGIERFEKDEIYVDLGSSNSTEVLINDKITLKVETYLPFNPPGFEMRYFNYSVGGSVSLDESTYLITSGRYNVYLRSLILANQDTGRRPQYNMILMSEDTLQDLLGKIFSEMRRPTKDQNGEALISLDRENLLNPWDIEGSEKRIQEILEEINVNGAVYYYVPRNYLGEVLEAISIISERMKTNTMLVVAPVFFTAWYLGITISEVVLDLRRREIGLLFIRGMTHRQVLYVLIFEALLIGVISALIGVLAGALILPLVIPEMNIAQILTNVNFITIGVTFIFSLVISLLSVYRPAQKALQVSLVESLREHRTEEETIGRWQEPLIALLLGGYKFIMLILGLSVEQIRPVTENMIITLLYNTWWGSDYLLGFISPILLFWGSTKLFLQYVPWFQTALGNLSGLIAGDAAKFASISSKRNVRRTAASMFMIALIIGYSLIVIGGTASTKEFTNQAIKNNVGADASVWLFEGADTDKIKEKISQIDGVISVTLETHFTPQSSLGDVPIRAIEPVEWSKTAYFEPGWIDDPKVFERMEKTEFGGIMEKGAAKQLAINVNNSFLVKIKSKVYGIQVLGVFGKEPGEAYMLQNPTVYVNNEFMKNVGDRYNQKRLLVDLEPKVDQEWFKTKVESLDPNIEKADLTQISLDNSRTNLYLVGPRRVEELGTFFATIVASIGVILIVSTMIRSRIKEYTIMSIRGFSSRQLAVSLIVDSLGIDILAIILGLGVGYVTLIGETEIFNRASAFGIERKVVYPLSAKINLLIIIGLLILSTVIPILIAVYRITRNPDLKLEE